MYKKKKNQILEWLKDNYLHAFYISAIVTLAILLTINMISSGKASKRADKIIEQQINEKMAIWDTLINSQKRDIDSLKRYPESLRKENEAILKDAKNVYYAQIELYNVTMANINDNYAKKVKYNMSTPIDTTNRILSGHLTKNSVQR